MGNFKGNFNLNLKKKKISGFLNEVDMQQFLGIL